MRVAPDARLLSLLALQVAGLAGILGLSGAYSVSFTEDSGSYLELSQGSPLAILTSGLGGMRRPGYPLFLAAARRISPDLSALPLLQLAFHGLAVAGFALGLRRLGFSSGLALVAASPLLYANTVLIDGSQVMAESAALSFALLSLAALFVALSAPARRGPWLALAVAALMAWLTRPVYQGLVLLLPALGLLLARLARPLLGPVPAGRLALRLLFATALPWLAFCGLRLLAVGHFGVASFGGVSLAGIAVPLLTEDLVRELPAARQPLAREVLSLARAGGAVDRQAPVHADYDRARLRPGHPRGSLFALRGALEASDDAYFQQDRAIWHVALPAVAALAARRGEERPSQVAVNAELRDLSLSILRLRPAAYARRVAASLALGLVLALLNAYAFWAALLLCLALVLLRHGFFAARAARTGLARAQGAARPARDRSLEQNVALLVTAVFALAQLLGVALLSAPTLRFADAAGALLPMAPMLAAAGLWDGIRRPGP